MEIHGITELIGDEKAAARETPGKGLFLYRDQCAGLIRVAVRRAAWQTAQTLAGVLEDAGENAHAEWLRSLTAEELADGIDVSAAVPPPAKPKEVAA